MIRLDLHRSEIQLVQKIIEYKAAFILTVEGGEIEVGHYVSAETPQSPGYDFYWIGLDKRLVTGEYQALDTTLPWRRFKSSLRAAAYFVYLRHKYGRGLDLEGP